jgi:hypothetical protein
MKTLDDALVIGIMREEWDKRVKVLSEKVDLTMSAPVSAKGEEKTILTPELKVRHKDSGIRYTIDSVGPRDVILRTPEGETFLVNGDELEQGYELD